MKRLFFSLAALLLFLSLTLDLGACSTQRYLTMSAEELEKLSDSDLYFALVTRTEDKVFRKETVKDGLQHLSAQEKTFYVVSYYDMEVNNGGLCQFFINSSRDVAPFLADALTEIGAEDHRALFEGFVTENGLDLNDLSAFQSDSYAEYMEILGSYPFTAYDNEFVKLPLLEPQLIAYARANLSYF